MLEICVVYNEVYGFMKDILSDATTYNFFSCIKPENKKYSIFCGISTSIKISKQNFAQRLGVAIIKSMMYIRLESSHNLDFLS